ncbi:unnamed protein product, partial [Prorocentrum cordatum]
AVLAPGRRSQLAPQDPPGCVSAGGATAWRAMSAQEDLQMTPQERERARAAAAAGGQKPTASEAAAFEAAEEVVLGGGGGEQHIVIVGAGLVGSLLAVVLLRKGFRVHIFERYADIRSIPTNGRSSQ